MTTDAAIVQDDRQPRLHRAGLSLALLAVLGLAVLAIGFMLARPLKVMPRLGAAPSFTLTDPHGQPLGSDDLRGKVVLYDFVYTSCQTVCPAMTAQMMQVQQRLADGGQLGEDVVLVTITFDPERDTPERLLAESRKFGAVAGGWHWLTGELIAIKQLVGGEFGVYFEKVAAEDAPHDEGHAHEGYDFVHATVFVLVDEEGQIRSEYHQMLDIDEVMRDIGLVVSEKNAPALARPVWQAAHAIRAYP